jgi:5-aminopentanamidase
MKAAFYQFDPVFGEREKNIAKVVAAAQGADTDLLVLPELFATGYQFISRDEVVGLSEPVPEGYTTRAIAGLSRSKGIYIVAGLAEKDGERLFNSAILTGPEGFIGVYRKTHLFFEEKLWFLPGDTGFRVFDTPLGRIGVMICFDWIFPESMRTLALMGAEVVTHPANLVLPHCPSAMPVRCLESRVWAVTANRIGVEQRKEGQALTFIGSSQITAPDGTICVRAPDNEESLMVLDVDPRKARDKSLNPYNDVLMDRRPAMYKT